MDSTKKVDFGELVLSSLPIQAEPEGASLTKAKRPRRPEFEVACSGIDFTVRRKTAKTSKLLVILVSQGQYYLKDERAGTVEALDAKVLERALDGMACPPKLECPWIERVPACKAERERLVEYLEDPGFELVVKSGLASLDECFYWRPNAQVLHAPECHYYEAKRLCELSMPLAKHVAKAAEGPAGMEVVRNMINFGVVYRAYGLDRARSFIDSYVQRIARIKDLARNRIHGCYIDQLEEMLMSVDEGFFDFDRLCDYLFNQSLAEGTASLSNWLRLWKDALDMQLALYDEVRDKYPRNLATAHDILAFKVTVSEEEIDAKLWRRAEERMALFDWEPEGAPFIITHPSSSDDLRAEGSYMSHCVAGYARKVAEGKSMVFFCRRAEDRGTPYVTVEVDLNSLRLVQAKSRFNQPPVPEVREFLDCWCMEHEIVFDRRVA